MSKRKIGPVNEAILEIAGDPRGGAVSAETADKIAMRILGQSGQSIVDLLRDPESADVEFDPPKLGAGLVRPADLG